MVAKLQAVENKVKDTAKIIDGCVYMPIPWNYVPEGYCYKFNTETHEIVLVKD
ncbi:MAG: hypothetical protein KAS87_06505 [Candidatus Omnitrophica bacterium]|nr:hypothetical protein [Candidatus Omnitrophota bacterium]